MKIINIFLISILLTNPAWADATISIWWKGKPVKDLYYAKQITLSSALSDPAILSYDSYWPVGQISTPARQQELEHQRQVLLADLTVLSKMWSDMGEPSLASTTLQLLQQLQQLELTGRFDVSVDPDVNQARAGVDAPILKGHYQLYLAPRHPEVQIAGLVKQIGGAPLLPGAGLREYWKRKDILEGGDPAGVYLVSPSGKYDWFPVAIWNERHVEAMPGATLFVGFSPDVLPKQYQNLNERILTLFANRMPK